MNEKEKIEIFQNFLETPNQEKAVGAMSMLNKSFSSQEALDFYNTPYGGTSDRTRFGEAYYKTNLNYLNSLVNKKEILINLKISPKKTLVQEFYEIVQTKGAEGFNILSVGKQKFFLEAMKEHFLQACPEKIPLYLVYEENKFLCDILEIGAYQTHRLKVVEENKNEQLKKSMPIFLKKIEEVLINNKSKLEISELKKEVMENIIGIVKETEHTLGLVEKEDLMLLNSYFILFNKHQCPNDFKLDFLQENRDYIMGQPSEVSNYAINSVSGYINVEKSDCESSDFFINLVVEENIKKEKNILTNNMSAPKNIEKINNTSKLSVNKI